MKGTGLRKQQTWGMGYHGEGRLSQPILSRGAGPRVARRRGEGHARRLSEPTRLPALHDPGEGAEDGPRLGGLALCTVPLLAGEPQRGLICLFVC